MRTEIFVCFFFFTTVSLKPRIVPDMLGALLKSLKEPILFPDLLRANTGVYFGFICIFFFSHPLAEKNINSISKVRYQRHEKPRLWTGTLEVPYIEYGDACCSCPPNTPFSFFLTSRVQIFFRIAICPALKKKKKKERNLYSLDFVATRNCHSTVLN